VRRFTSCPVTLGKNGDKTPIPQPETHRQNHITPNPQRAARNPQPAAGLYIHIPFCIQKCPYCDFYSIADLPLIPAYLFALTKEMQAASRHDRVFDTVYLGGGTPSVLSSGQVAGILENVFRWFSIAADAEITIEVNPGTVTQNRLADYRRAGIHRVNIGVQSFNPDILGFLKRIHSADQAIRAIRQARDAGFENLGIDLIYGVPEQDRPAWRRDLKTALAFAPEHLSCYMLSYEKGTPLEHDLRKNRFKPLPEKTTAGLFEMTHARLADAGYEHYEISNFARKDGSAATPEPADFRSRHNRKYWTSAPYIGLGPAAHSYSRATRSWNYADVRRYIACLDAGKLPVQGKETLTRNQQMMETIYLGLRTVEGIDISGFEKKFDMAFKPLLSTVLSDMIPQGWITLSEERCALTLKGMLLLDSIAARLTDELPD
jgi:oxygen-independent coproporphyrinogen-3 oxidase